MKKLEIIFGGLAILSMLLNLLFLMPGAAIMMLIGFASISVFYMYFSFALFNGIAFRGIFKKESYVGISRTRIIGAVLVGFALSVSSVGILFKMMAWPGANENLLLGLAAFFIALLVGAFRYANSPDPYYRQIFKRIAIYGGLALAVYLLPSETRVEIQYRNHPAYLEAYKKALQDPNNQELWEQVHQEQLKMDRGN